MTKEEMQKRINRLRKAAQEAVDAFFEHGPADAVDAMDELAALLAATPNSTGVSDMTKDNK